MSVCMNCSQHKARRIDVVALLIKFNFNIQCNFNFFQLARAAQELLMSVCMNCSQHDASDIEVIALLIKIRMKTKPLINHYLNCMR